MFKVGDTFTDPNTNRTYQCLSVVTISPTLINKHARTYTTWKDITYTVGAGAGSGEPAKTIVLEDESGNRIIAVLVDEEVDFTATANDIREGKIAATDNGVTVGEKFIPSYNTTEGTVIVMNGRDFSINLGVRDLYDYTKFQAVLCPLNGSLSKSVSCEKVVINDHLYAVLSTDSISEVFVDSENKTINLGITNDSGSPYVIRYITYKEVY